MDRYLLAVDLADDFVATDATSANIFRNDLAVFDDADLLYVHIPVTGALTVAVAHVIAGHSAFAANTAYSRHNPPPWLLCFDIIARTEKIGKKIVCFFCVFAQLFTKTILNWYNSLQIQKEYCMMYI